MREPESYSFRRYLDAKRTVDERARNARVLDAFRGELSRMDEPLKVCEVGVGTGTLVTEVRGWTDREVRYTGIDADGELTSAAAASVADAARADGHSVRRSPERVVVDEGDRRFEVEFATADGLQRLADAEEAYDAVLAQAFLDLTDVGAALSAVASALRPGGVGYFPITFDGVTAFLPRFDPEFDERVECRFHRHMDETPKAGGATGDSRAGRHLLTAVPESGGELLAAGGSDWVVAPDGDGYPADEAYFLHHLVETVREALAADGSIDADRLDEWADARHDRVTRGELTYLAHQLDVLARWPGADVDR